MPKTIKRLLALLAVASVIGAYAPAIASAEAKPEAGQTSSSTQIYIDEYGGSHVQSETRTVLPGGVVQQQNYSSSSQTSGLLHYRTVCIQGQCQIFVLNCQAGQCQYRQVPIFYLNTVPSER